MPLTTGRLVRSNLVRTRLVPAVLAGADFSLGGQEYYQKVLATRYANLIGYWPLWETTGVSAADLSRQGNHGTYSNVILGQPGIGDGKTCPLFNGTTAFGNIYSASLNADFDGQRGTLMAWCKVSAGSVWTDATTRLMAILRSSIDNRIQLNRDTTNNQISWLYRAGAVSKSVVLGSITTIGWFQMTLTWDLAASQMLAYFNGAQTGSTQTALGTWAGSLASGNCCIGAASTTPTSVWSGYIAHVALWNTVLTPAEVAMLAPAPFLD